MGNSANCHECFPARTKHKLQAMRASLVVCFAVQCSVAEVDGCGRVQDCNGAREQAGGVSRGAHAKVKLSLLILDSTRATRIKCSNLDNGTA